MGGEGISERGFFKEKLGEEVRSVGGRRKKGGRKEKEKTAKERAAPTTSVELNKWEVILG